MRNPLDAGSGHRSAWKRLLLTGTLLASCTSSASPELPSSASLDPKTEEASAHLPVPGNLDGVLSTSWFPGHKAQPETMIFSPEGLPGPGHTGQEMLGTQGNLDITSMTAQDSGSHTAVPGTSRRRGNATERIHVRAALNPVMLLTFPETLQGVIQSELNYSVILECLIWIIPDPVMHWTLDGKPYRTGERLIIRRLSWEQLGTYVCTAKGSQEQYSSTPVTVSLPRDNVGPTVPEPIEPDPSLTLSGGAALGLLLAGNIGALMLIGGVGFTIVQSQRTDRQRMWRCC
ncbi:immunoglobulin superfamily member 23 isoform X2 [Manis pentadactyla]|uniref:immunoglobulin superfamily member 23 isoform X2 n=1 Tax=Manis pentadactyla TaxID=143292 RepID=UPI00255C9894|nr:immunoglobulin superfamily member 23 isoform X2 [Manis pentadactyla]